MAGQYGKGFAATSAIRQATSVAWGVPHATACGANHGFAFVDEDIKNDSQLIPDEQADGQVTEAQGDKGAELVSGPRSMDVPFEGLDIFFALAMGSVSAATQQGSDNAYLHVLKPAKNKEGKFATIATSKVTHVEEIPSVKVDGFAFSVKSKERARVQFPLIGSSMHYNTTTGEVVNGVTGVNTLTSMANVTLNANYNKFVQFRQMRVLANLVGAAGLAPGTDDLYISEFALNLNNNFAGDEISTRRGYLNDEPLQDGKSQFTGMFQWSRLNDDAGGAFTHFARNRDKSRYKVKVEFLGDAIGASAFRLTFWLPNVQFVELAAPVNGVKRIQPRFGIRPARADAAPTGFPVGYVDPVTIEIVNQINAPILT